MNNFDNKPNINIPGKLYTQQHLFYKSLSLYSNYYEADKSAQKEILKQIIKIKAELEKTEKNSINENNYYISNKLLFIEALIAEMENEFGKAIILYDKSIKAARQNNFHLEDGLANEMAGRLCIYMNQTDISGLYISEARKAYVNAGSEIHLRNLDDVYTKILNFEKSDNSILSPNQTYMDTSEETPGIFLQGLDLAAFIKSSQIISGEIILDNLLKKLIIILLENSGADRVLLMLEKDSELFIKSSGTAEKKEIEINKSIPVNDSGILPVSIISFSKRTMENVILNNAMTEGMFTKDPYIIQNRIKSVACIPLIIQKVLRGMVYLENRLTSDAFLAGRLEIIKLLSTQAAISLENALLFEKTKEAEMDIQEQYEEIESQYEEMSEMNRELEITSQQLLIANETLAIFKKFAEASGQGMGMTDLDGKITYGNQSLCNMVLESSTDALIGNYFNRYYSDELKIKISKEILPLIKKGGEWVGEINLMPLPDIIIPAIHSFFSINDNAGKPVYMATIITDITERKKLEEQILHSQKMEAVGRLAGGIAHDFNNLLTAIIGNSEMLLLEIEQNDARCSYVKEIIKSAKRSAALTHQLLAFSRKQMLNQTNTDINNVILNIKDMLDRLVGEDINISTLLMDSLDSVYADKGQIDQVIMNLVVNARDAMPEGGTITIVSGKITIKDEDLSLIPNSKPGRFVCISIEDNGTGIEEEDLNKIFEPFYTTKDPEKGTGLGLSVVYGIIAQHNGWINVKSVVGKGTAFHIYLPSISVREKAAAIEENKPLFLNGKGEKILLVEDQPEVLKFTSKALRAHGYFVVEARTCREAMKIFEQETVQFNLIFSDVVLPDLSGIQLIEFVLSRTPGMPIILTSGYTDQKSQWETIRDKGYHFLEKPYTLHELLSLINSVLIKSPKK